MTNNYLKIIRLALVVIFIEILFSLYYLLNTIQLKNNTTLISVKSLGVNDSLMVGVKQGQFMSIGRGEANIRLSPGNYVVESYSGRLVDIKTLSVGKKTQTIQLSPSLVYRLPVLSNVIFDGLSALSNNGITVSQINMLKSLLFTFRPYGQNISIIDNSLTSSLPNPANSNPFSLQFNLKIDSTIFKANLSYGSDLNSITLNLYDNNNKLVYSSQ